MRSLPPTFDPLPPSMVVVIDTVGLLGNSERKIAVPASKRQLLNVRWIVTQNVLPSQITHIFETSLRFPSK